MSDIRAELTSVVKKIQPEAVLDTADCFDLRFREIGIDSLEVMNVLLAVQENFGIEIPDADIDALHTLGDVEKYIAARK